MHKVFVYGTLKRGYGNNALINKSKVISLKVNAPGINLYSSGPLPFAARGNGTAIGELYEVDDIVLAKLDKLEGHPVFYKREKTKVQLASGEVEAWIYLCDKYAKQNLLIQSGEWEYDSKI
jgi:gamma-glutamylcyclotransferase (GGCT)/AIG2-like uncharacterized protein YtfP